MAERICIVSGCTKSQHGGGRQMCPMHYRRFRKHGSTDDPCLDNFARYEVSEETGCWQWTGPVKDTGYGMFSRPFGGERAAHRAFWVRDRGPIGEGLEVDHLCRNRGCVNPDHLEVVTRWENVQRAKLGQWGTETCRSGKHDVTKPEAWIVFPSRPDVRWCRGCYQEHNERQLAKKREGRPSRRTHCRNGHEYTPETTKRLKDGTKRCLICIAIRKGKST